MSSRLVAVVVVGVCVASATCEDVISSEKFVQGLLGDGGGGGVAGRTLGHHVLKRLAFIFLPVMFTLGVISTLLLGLSVLAIKNLAVGVVLLVIGVSQAISRVLFSAAPAPAPFVQFAPLRARSDPAFAAPAAWPAAAPAPAPYFSPWARSDNEGVNVDE